MNENDWNFIDLKALGRNIYHERIKNGMTVLDLTSLLNKVSVAEIQNWEKGEGLPNTKNLIEMCNLWRISLKNMVKFKKKYSKLLKDVL